MGLLSGLFWTLAGGAYAAGRLFNDNVKSQGYAYPNIVHKTEWYEEHALELDHDRQRELYQIYRNDLDLFERMSGEKEANHNNRYYYSTGMRDGSFFESAARTIANNEGWEYDEDFRLNPVRKSDASENAWAELDKHDEYIKSKRAELEEAVRGKNIPCIGENYHWWIEGEDTGFLASAPNLPNITEDGYWRFGSVRSKWKCLDEKQKYLTGTMGDILSEHFYSKDGFWYIDDYVHLLGRVDVEHINTGIQVTDNTAPLILGEDGYFYCNGVKTTVSLAYSSNFWRSKTNTWKVSMIIEISVPPYRNSYGEERSVKYATKIADTHIPIIKPYRLREDSVFVAKVTALKEAADYGWEGDKVEWESVCRNASNRPFIERIVEDNGIIPGPPDPKTLEAERKRRLKAHENPVKLNEWCNLFFDLVHGEEKLRAESPGEYEKLLEKFKEITGEDFVRGVDYLDKLRGLAIADGWYIPEISNKWFDNPPPPEPPEEPYGTAELPTRYL